MKKKIVLISFILFSLLIHAQDLTLLCQNFGDTLVNPAEVKVIAQSIDYNPDQPAHIHIINTEGGYRKLKLGNNPYTLYKPQVDVLAGGNTHLQITLRTTSGITDWSKIKFRPSSIGSLALKKYVDEAGGINSLWKTINIPLSDFDTGIDFTQLALIEFPYSANAEAFAIDVAKIEFTGGLSPYLWYGNDKTDNIHDGYGGPGQLLASYEEAIQTENILNSIEIYLNDKLIESATSHPFEFNISINELGAHSIYAIARFKDNTSKTSRNYQVFTKEIIPSDLSIALNKALIPDTVMLNTSVKLKADVLGATVNEAAYLAVSNQNGGYLKLKLAYDPNNIYAAGKNVIIGGNTKLAITLRNKSGFTNWSKLRLRPKSTGSLNLQTYVDAVNGISNEWTTLEIPLSDFDPSIDFSNLNYMEFPYSADAGAFDFEIKDIVFTGGEEDFRWFGEDKIDNKHDGDGGAGQLIAEIIKAQTSENGIKAVDFYLNNNLISSDIYAPFETEYTPQSEGIYNAYAIVSTQNAQTEKSADISFLALKPKDPLSVLKISFLSSNQGDSALANQNLTFTPSIEGEDLETAIYLRTWNTETGYRKLKFGYDNNSIYGQFQDVTSSGNDTLEIVLKSSSSNIPWDRISIRPSSLGTLTLTSYITNASDEWITVKIPLSDFDAGIDFTQLSYLEFPYSANAGAFEIGIKKMQFIGGENPFEWFGPNHYKNAHDGTGESGRIYGQLQIPSQNPLTTDTVFFLVDGNRKEYSTQAPYSFNYTATSTKTESFSFKLTDSYGYSTVSNPIDIKFYEFNTDDYSLLTLTFDHDPGNVQITLSPLKYNKDFAYSFTLDDGKYDAYSYAFKLLNGGELAQTGEYFDGLFYTNGSNLLVPFRASVAWNSVNSSFFDIHNNTPDYITWTKLQELIAAKWGVLNHSYSHAAYGDTDYNFQVSENSKKLFEKTGYKTTHFVIPSGDLNYVEAAFANNIETIYSNKIDFLGYRNGIDIDSPFNTNQLKIYRRYMNDDLFDSSNIMEKIDEIANLSVNGNHIWWHDFTHRIIPTPTGGSLIWDSFKYYMQQIEQNYGASGTDRIWFAPPTEILNYLKVRENTSLNYETIGNTVKVYLSTTEIPLDLNDYFISLNVLADAELLSVSPEFSANISFANKTNTEKLVNIAWAPPTMKRMKSIPFSNNKEEVQDVHFAIYPNPNPVNKMHIAFNHPGENSYFIQIKNTLGQKVLDQEFSGNKGNNLFNLDISNLNSGIYFLSIINSGQLLKTEKIVIQ